MNIVIKKIFSKLYLIKFIFVFLIVLEFVVSRYQRAMLFGENFVTLLVEIILNPYFLYNVLFISIFIVTYDSISEVYLNNEFSMKMDRRKILLSKTLEFTFKYISVLLIVFVICSIITIISDSIAFSFSWDSKYINDRFEGSVITQIPVLLVLFSVLLKYYLGAFIMFLVGYYIYLITSNPTKGIVAMIAVIISYITIGKDAHMLMMIGEPVMETIAKITVNYNIGMVNYQNAVSINSFLVKEAISFVYLLVLSLILYIMCENRIVKKDIL